jgi:hypothetical protein
MNNRIEELKHLASVWCDENIPEQFSEETNGYGAAWEDKFAELIVKECCVIMATHAHRPAGVVKRDVKEHFGVKE